MKFLKNLFAISMLLCVIVAPFILISPVYAAADVNILTHSGWLDSIGYYHVSGEVENVGDSAASFVKITATFYDAGHTVVDTSFTFAMLDILLPGRKSPFEVLLIDTTQATKVDHYSLSVTFSTTDPIPIGLKILSNSSYVDIVNYMHVVGEIKNVATGTATFVEVIATFYNATGNVVATAFTFSDPSDLNPNQTAPFEVLLIYSNRVSLVVSYTLTAESSQYAIVPEVPTWVSMLFVLIILTVTMAIYKRRLLKTPMHACKDYQERGKQFNRCS
jgi:hypothetical protein